MPITLVAPPAAFLSTSVDNAANSDVAEVLCRDVSRLAFEIKAITQTFNAFFVQAKVQPLGSYRTIVSAAGGYTSPSGIIVAASGDLTALAAGSTGWLIVDVLGLYSLKLQAKGVAGGGSCDIYVGGQ
jgi:hypothetical protein